MHRGGFVKGRRDQDIVFCRNICSRSGCAILDVDYVPPPAKRFLHSNHGFLVQRRDEYEVAEQMILNALKTL